MDDLAAPVTGTYSDAPREPLITLVEARDVVRLLRHFAETHGQGSDEGLDAYALATELAGRLSSE
ncbi:hypothetical protein GCM10010331_49570 [Streptomyces xanthochromogenes]|uniref:hypothetical protein n=1 Tax=Streptomyces xanthochromogenes TaxID=67384 RepID=UPI001678690D|nr:hypothetical protein [Streptomyces xanthochromogenes]GHB55801.1 hypothetical protein GCM10010331_49570 [Streptomyces xanthochromogenes]